MKRDVPCSSGSKQSDKQAIGHACTLLPGLDSLRRRTVPLFWSPKPYRYDEIWSRKGFT
jgi:hypothetical protein